MLPAMGRVRSRHQQPLVFLVLVLVPMLLTGCARKQTLEQAASTPSAEASPSAAASASAAASPGNADDVPEEFRAACGNPGSKVSTERLRVVIRRADCDLTGVTISSQGRSVEVPEPGGGVGNSSGVYVEVDEAGVMTFRAEAEVAQL
jgi:hypothetical protein